MLNNTNILKDVLPDNKLIMPKEEFAENNSINLGAL